MEGTRSSSTFGYAAWAGMACSGGSTASRGWWRGRYGGGGGSGRRRVRSGPALGGGETSMAAVLGSRGGGSRTGADEKPSVRRRAKEEGNIWGGPFVPGEATTRDKRTFCPGSWLHPGQKGFLGGPGKFPARGPPLVPGGSTTRDKRSPFSLVPA